MDSKHSKTNCSECTLNPYKYCPWQYAKITQYPVLIVGQAPGAVEAITRTPFTGPAGKTLWRIMKEAGLEKAHFHITNICQCAPPEDRAPGALEIEACKGHLEEEIQQVKPKLIIALGEVATLSLTGRKGIQTLRGQIYPLLSKWGWECPVLCMLHPSFVMRQRQWIDIAVKDFTKISKFFTEGTIVKEAYKPEFIYDPDPSTLASLLEEMGKGVTAVDIETPGELDVLSASVIGIAFCSHESKALGLDFTSGGMRGESWEVMKRFLEDPKTKKCTQNGQFDLGVLETNGVVVKGLSYDTLLAEHTMNSDLPGNLDSLRSRYTDLPGYKPEKKSMKSIGSWDKEKRLEYNCWDVVATHLVRLGQTSVMDPKQMKVLEEIELPLIYVCNHMERKGIKVNINTLALLYQQLQPKAEKYYASITQHGVNPRSPLSVKKFFNLTSSDADTLKDLVRKGHPKAELLEDILQYRTFDKALSTYVVGVYNRLRGERIHAHPKIEGTATGRLAYRDPNLQNVPKELRVIYTPDSEDHCLIEADYSQLELRVIALLAPEPTMLQEMAEGKRIHTTMGREIYHKEWDDLTPQEQVRAKGVVFGTVYGRSARSIAIEYGVPIKTAEEWQMVCVRKYPGIAEYVKRQSQEFYSRQKVNTPFGRVRTLQSILQAYNTPIQSSGSDVMLLSLIELFKAGFDLRISVHDSVIINVEKRHALEASEEITMIMQRPIPQLSNYQFPVKLQAGLDWFNTKDLKEII